MDTNREIQEILKANQARSGAKKYIWRTKKDAKVRSSHFDREGKVYSWDKPPPGGHPGEAFGCRCWAEPVFEEEMTIEQKREARTMGGGTLDFIDHYFTGNGKRVMLQDLGLAKNFENAPSVRKVTDAFIDKIIPQAHDGFKARETSATNVTWELSKGLFVVGDSTFFMEVDCQNGICTFTFSIEDEFRNPLDIEGVEIPGGTIYEIDHKWQIKRRFR